jgi:diguanylate cyclase (GGDEF)-like protein/PAS domain S-box-containing protein
VTSPIHRLLKKQYTRLFREGRGSPFHMVRRLLRAISDTYRQEDEQRRVLERSLDIGSQEIAQRSAQIRSVFQMYPDAFLVVDASGVIVEATGAIGNPGAPYSWLDRPLAEFPNTDIGRRFSQAFLRVRENRTPATFEYSLAKGAEIAFHEARLRPLEEGHVLVVVRDVSEHRLALEALRTAEERFALAARAANDGLWDWDLPVNRIIYSPRWKTILGHTDEDIANTSNSWMDRVHPEDVEPLRRGLASLSEPGRDTLEMEYRIRHRDNSYRWVATRAIAVRNASGQTHRLVGSMTDITPHKAVEEQLRHEAFHDKVTGLANRALFLDRLTNILDRVKRQPGYLFSVLYVDLDRFSTINERVGHEAADRLLQTVAARLRSYARVGDTVARLGDDEFAVLLDGIANERAAVIFAERMRELIAAPVDLSPDEISVTASLGIAINSPETNDAETLLNEAESAMQRAKQTGKNRQELFNRETHAHLVSKLRIETELRHAAERGELEIFYQPIYRLSDQKIIRAESLLRWRHPQRGMISPADFIPVAEETGLILALGDWILREVSEQAKRWRQSGVAPLTIAVNFSPRQFQQQNLLTTVGATLARFKDSGFPLELEITESAAMHDVDLSVKIMKNLRDMDVRISIDDFGVGYSSLSCLRLFPLNTLKIDRGFVEGIPEVKDNSSITNAIIGIGHSLGLSVVAEGVETNEQLTYLKQQGCDEVQGFLLSRPLSAKDVTPRLPKASANGSDGTA